MYISNGYRIEISRNFGINDYIISYILPWPVNPNVQTKVHVSIVSQSVTVPPVPPVPRCAPAAVMRANGSNLPCFANSCFDVKHLGPGYL